MQVTATFPGIWLRWLVALVVGLMAFGLSMVLAPAFILRVFSLLIYSSPEHLESFGSTAVAYISLAHAILGAVMLGWGVALLFVVLGAFRRGAREGWQIVVVSVTAWLVPDTLFSLWFGFWQNAILNAFIGVLFAIPLAATYRAFHEASA